MARRGLWKKRLMAGGLSLAMAFALLPQWGGMERVEAKTNDENEAIALDETNFPDDEFRFYFSAYDSDSSGYLEPNEIEGITSIDISGLVVKNVSGINYFWNLRYLYCQNNYLSSLDVSNCSHLKVLSCGYGQIEELNISGCSELEYLDCSSNNLNSLNISNNPHLTTLDCSDNQLSELDVSNNIDIDTLTCSDNCLTSLNLGDKSAVASLYCANNSLQTLDLSGCSALTSLYCQNNPMTVLNIKKNPGLLQAYSGDKTVDGSCISYHGFYEEQGDSYEAYHYYLVVDDDVEVVNSENFYKITFDAGEGKSVYGAGAYHESPWTIEVAQGESLVGSNYGDTYTVSDDDLTCIGWVDQYGNEYWDRSGSWTYNDIGEYVPTEDLTLSPIWRASHMLSYDFNGGEYCDDTMFSSISGFITLEFIENAPLISGIAYDKEEGFYRDGYTFAGWKVLSGTNAGTVYTCQELVEQYSPKEDSVIQVMWRNNSSGEIEVNQTRVKVTFDTGYDDAIVFGGPASQDRVGIIQCYVGEPIGWSNVMAYREGHTLLGWRSELGYVYAPDEIGGVVITQETTFTAVWDGAEDDEEVCYVTFDPKGAKIIHWDEDGQFTEFSSEPSVFKCQKGDCMFVPNYKDGPGIFVGIRITSGEHAGLLLENRFDYDNFEIEEDFDCELVWDLENLITVTLDPDGGTITGESEGEIDVFKWKLGSDAGVNLGSATKDGYTLVGWKQLTGLDAGTVYKEYDIVYPEEDVSYIALWEEESVECTHSWDEGTLTIAPTCIKKGLKSYTCSICGATKNEEVPATGHHEVKAVAVAPTCTKAGKTEGTYCSVCGAVIKAQEEIKATGHTVVTDTAVTATIEMTGLTEGSHCSVCGTVFKKQEVIPKLTPPTTPSITPKTPAVKNGWKKEGGKWFYYLKGTKQKGWKQIGKKWYFFKKDGSMAANEWCKGYWLNKNGTWTYKKKATWKKDSVGWWFGCKGWYAKNQWQKIDDKWYYFNAKGYIVTGTRKIGGKQYKFNKSGVCLNP